MRGHGFQINAHCIFLEGRKCQPAGCVEVEILECCLKEMKVAGLLLFLIQCSLMCVGVYGGGSHYKDGEKVLTRSVVCTTTKLTLTSHSRLSCM